MKQLDRLTDSDHPWVREIAFQLTEGATSDEDKLRNLFFFVRDEIRFGFPSRLEDLKASEVLSEKMGVCFSKSTLFKALLQAARIPARVHYGAVELQIFRGIVPGWMMWPLPKVVNHAWLEVQLYGQWRAIDSFIFDRPYFQGAKQKLAEEGLLRGYGLASPKASCAFHFGEKGFVQMDAVVEDFGTWDDEEAFFDSGLYEPMDERFAALYPKLAALVNRRIRQIRIQSIREEEQPKPMAHYFDQLLTR